MKLLDTLTEEARDELELRGIRPEIAEQHGVRSAVPRGDDDRAWIAFRHTIDGENDHFAVRTITGTKQFFQSKGTDRRLWNNEAIANPDLAQQPLIITEGQLDALALLGVGFDRVVSVPDGAPSQAVGDSEEAQSKYRYLDGAALAEVREIILASDGDEPGRALMSDLAIRLGRHRCRFVKWPKKTKDACDVLAEYGAEVLVQTINSAKWFKLDGCYRWHDLPDVPPETPFPVGIAGLDELWKPSSGRMTVLTGVPGHGKTALITDIVCHLAEAGKVVCLGSLEEDVRKTIGTKIMSWFLRKRVEYAKPSEIEYVDGMIQKRFLFIQPDEDDEEPATVGYFMERAAAMVVRNNASFVVLDPWNEIDHTDRPGGVSPTEYIGVMLKRLRRHAKRFDYHLLIAAHPTKLGRGKDGHLPIATGYDISDSANWVNKPDNGLTVYRRMDGTVTLSSWKCKAEGVIGTLGERRFSFNDQEQRFQHRPDLEGVV